MDICAVKGCTGHGVLELPTICDPVVLCERHARDIGIALLVPAPRAPAGSDVAAAAP